MILLRAKYAAIAASIIMSTAMGTALAADAAQQAKPGVDAAPVEVQGPAAQTSSDPETEKTDAYQMPEIVVFGIRNSLRQALDEKRSAPNIVEALVAEDIGKLPDISIAESLARLPGLATNRDRGNGTQISIRGLGPNLVSTLLNGRELVSADADRNIRYDSYPAEMLNGAYVYKSPTAYQVEGGIAGQVNLGTIRPLDYGRTELAFNARAAGIDLSDKIDDAPGVGYLGSASYIGQFFDKTLGFAIGYAGRSEAIATARTNVFRYTNSFADLDGNGTGNDNIPFGYEALVRGGHDKRKGATAALQWRPSANFELNADLFYSLVNFDETQRGFRVEGLPFGNTFTNPRLVDGAVTGITATRNADFGLAVRNVNELFFFKDDLLAGGLNARWSGDQWTTTADVGHSKVHRDQQFVTVRTEPSPAQLAAGVTGTFASHPGNPADFAFNFDLSDPNRNYIADIQIPENGGGAPLVDDELTAARLDFKYANPVSWLDSIEFGARASDRNKDYTQRTQFGFIDPAQRIPVPADLLLAPIHFPGNYSGVPTTLAIDIPGAIARFFGAIDPQQSPFDARSSWVVTEQTTAAYAQLNFTTQWGDYAVDGNLGVRAVNTKTTSSSVVLNDGPDTNFQPVLTPVKFTNEFTDTLPSLNMTLHLNDEQQMRLALSRAIARAPLDDLNAGFGVFVFGAPAAFGGNPKLEPFRANQFDLTYERYFNKETAVTVSAFYKDIDTFIVQQLTPITVDVGGVPTEGTFRQPVNGKGGNIKGVEFLYQQAFTFLPHPFDGLGVYANYSYTDSSITVNEADNFIAGNIPLPGLSKHVGNVVLYFARNGFESRVGYRYRSSYATELGDADRILIYGGEGVVDFQASYEFQKDSALAGLRLLFQANNLTDRPFQDYYGVPTQQGRFENFGRRYFLGFSYKFGL